MHRILIVEDSRTLARDLELRLVRFGYGIAGVTGSGERAIELARAERPALILADIRLEGELDGIAVAEHALTRLDIPTVFLTGQPDDAIRAARLTEPFGYIIKPFHDRELEVVIEIALYKHTADRERRERELHARRTEAMVSLGQLAGGVVHDFNNILTVILSTCAALLGDADCSRQASSRIALIRASAERAARMTNRLLAIGREPGAQPATEDLAALLTGSAAMLEHLLGGAVGLALTIEPGLRPITANGSEIEQLILNLALNARDAMPNGGTVELAASNTTRDGVDHVTLTVTDHGEGMDEATRRKIFDPFFTTKDAGKGTGWGLATVRAIVDRARGAIEVTSAPCHGTCFTITLPAAPGAEAQSRDAATLTGTVVVAEHRTELREVMRNILQAAGLDVIEARDRHEVLAACRSFPDRIDVVLYGLAAPAQRGPDLAHELAALAPSVALVQLASEPAEPHARAAVLREPFTSDELVAVVARALRGSLRAAPDAPKE